MQIDMPKVSFGIGVAVMIETAIGGGTLSLTNMIPPPDIPVVQAWCNALAFVGATILTGLHAFSGPSTGVLASPPTIAQAQQVMTAAKTAAVILIGALVLWPGSSVAQTRRPPALTGNPVQDIKNAIAPSATTSAGATQEGGAIGQALAQALSKPFIDIANFINSDLDGAIKLSTAIPTLQDGNGQQCWMALKSFGDVIKAHPLPLSGKAVTDLEAARLMTMAANRLCGEPHCTQVFADLANAATQAASLVPGAGGIAVPSLNSLCSHVPVVVVAAPVTVPAAASAPTASPAPMPVVPSPPNP